MIVKCLCGQQLNIINTEKEFRCPRCKTVQQYVNVISNTKENDIKYKQIKLTGRQVKIKKYRKGVNKLNGTS